MGVPVRFEAIGEALASGSSSTEACAVVGRDLARDGASLHDGLESLRTTYRAVAGVDPSYDDVLALSQGWSESTLGFLHQISCADPMTGLATLHHLRTRLSDLYRVQHPSGARVRHSHALVVADLPSDPMGLDLDRVDTLTWSLRMARLGEAARTVFPGADTIAGVATRRVLVLTERDDRLGQRGSLLRRMVDTLEVDGRHTRVWIEGLPPTDAGAVSLLDELARD
jgi:hypothetical protein